MRTSWIILVAMVCGPVLGDVIVLKDGTRVEGDVKRRDDGYHVISPSGETTRVPFNQVASIQLGKSTSPNAAMDRLASLKRSVESVDDINAILSRYEAFIEQKENASAVDAAKKELAIWRERAASGMVKIAGKWVSPEQHTEIVRQSGEIIREAYELMLASRIKEAEPLLKEALEIDPQNPVANYLMGVILYRADRLPQARKAFEITREQLPSDAATLNNLAVIVWRQNQFINALGLYADAMLAMPANKEILNNVAEALFALKDDLKKNVVAQRTSRLFVEQEAELERVMAQYGWYRWGSMWLNQDQINELKRAEQEVKDKLASAQKEFDELVKKRNDNETQIERERRIKQDVESRMYVYDSYTRTYRRIGFALPESWYEADREEQRLLAENKTIERNLAALRAQAVKLDASKPKPRYTGQQNLIGVEGTPRVGLLAPETEAWPTTAPATPAAPVAVPRQPASPQPVPVAPLPATPPALPTGPATNSIF